MSSRSSTHLLREPEFRDDKLDLAQKEYFDAISRRNDDVDEHRRTRSSQAGLRARRIPMRESPNTRPWRP